MICISLYYKEALSVKDKCVEKDGRLYARWPHYYKNLVKLILRVTFQPLIEAGFNDSVILPHLYHPEGLLFFVHFLDELICLRAANAKDIFDLCDAVHLLLHKVHLTFFYI